jgi:hypothetical protein
MTVSELKAILDQLPDDTEVFVNHERFRFREPVLFFSESDDLLNAPMVVVIPSETPAINDAQERPWYRHLQAPE